MHVGRVKMSYNILGMENPHDLPCLSPSQHIWSKIGALNPNFKNPNSKNLLNPLQTLKLLHIALKEKYLQTKCKNIKGHIEAYSQKPNEWVGITNEPPIANLPVFVCMCNYSRALFACVAFSVLPLFRFALPFLFYFYSAPPCLAKCPMLYLTPRMS
jgi:hypothetical protein